MSRVGTLIVQVRLSFKVEKARSIPLGAGSVVQRKKKSLMILLATRVNCAHCLPVGSDGKVFQVCGTNERVKIMQFFFFSAV